MTKWTGIKKAVAEINSSYRLVYRVYANTETGKVWANEYVSENDYTVYEDPAIIKVATFGNLYRNSKVTMAQLRELVEEAAKA